MKVDAIRFIPSSFDPYQGRVSEGGFMGTDYAVSMSRRDFDRCAEALAAVNHPWGWVVLGKDAPA